MTLIRTLTLLLISLLLQGLASCRERQSEFRSFDAAAAPPPPPPPPPRTRRGLQDDDGGGKCAVAGKRAIECGSTNDSRPQFCCGGLVCRNVKCVDPDGEGAEDDDGAADEAETEPPTTTTDEPPATEPPATEPPAAAPAAAIAADGVDSDGGACAAKGQRSTGCGSPNPLHPPSCCAGLVCVEDRIRCVDPLDLLESTDGSRCAGEGSLAKACGGRKASLPDGCCGGLACDEPTKACVRGGGGTGAQVVADGAATEQPTAAPTDGGECAEADTRSVGCGSTNPLHPLRCCQGLVCKNVKCVADDSCAASGDTAKECGAKLDGRPEVCCGDAGLACDFVSHKCLPLAGGGGGTDPQVAEGTDPPTSEEEEVADETDPPTSEESDPPTPGESADGTDPPTPEEESADGTDPPTPEPEGPVIVPEEEEEEEGTTVDLEVDPECSGGCALAGERSQECGSTNPDRHRRCCAGHACSITSFYCVVAPAGTPSPTCAPPTSSGAATTNGDGGPPAPRPTRMDPPPSAETPTDPLPPSAASFCVPRLHPYALLTTVIVVLVNFICS